MKEQSQEQKELDRKLSEAGYQELCAMVDGKIEMNRDGLLSAYNRYRLNA